MASTRRPTRTGRLRRSAPISLRGRCSDDASRPRFVADGPSTAPFAQCWHDQTSHSDRAKPNGCARTADQRESPVAAPATPVIRLAELLGRLSLAFDIANDAPYGKGVRSVVLAVELGRRAGATDGELHDTFWLSLLGYLGCKGLQDEQIPLLGGPRRPRATSPSSWRRSSARVPMSSPRSLNCTSAVNRGQPSPPTPCRRCRCAWCGSPILGRRRTSSMGAPAPPRSSGATSGSELDPRLADRVRCRGARAARRDRRPSDLRSISRDRTRPRRLRRRA